MADLAATLHTSAIDEADEANVTFLRDSLESLDRADRAENDGSRISNGNSRRTHTQTDPQRPDPGPPSQLRTDTIDDLSRRERLQRVLARLNRIHDPSASNAAAYSNRTPSPNRQSLYDWAPSHDETRRDEESELDLILADLRRQQPDTHPDILRVLSQNQLESARQHDRDAHISSSPGGTSLTDAAERRDRLRERRRRENEWASLRSRAVLQRARQEGSPSATERMLRYVMERERSGMSEEEERARETGWANELRARTLQERADVQRRFGTDHAPPPRLPRIATPPVPASSTTPTSSSHMLENALKYLNQLRSCYQYEDSLAAAIEHGLATKEFFADKHDDFIMTLEDEVKPIAPSSWLQPGTVFQGHQHATSGNAGLLQSRHGSASASRSLEQINPNFRGQSAATPAAFDHPPGSTRVTAFDATRPWLSHQFTPPMPHILTNSATKPSDTSHDHWPVRVIIHTVDTERMTLQGTMEAYDVPQPCASVSILNPTDRPKAGKKNAPITTYLEGHIIDLATHSFLTPSPSETKRHGLHVTNSHNITPYTVLADEISFPSASAHTDASNWRKLPPFNALASDEESARCLLSQARVNEIHQEFIFMRWKERCFVHGKDDKCSEAERGGDQDRGHGLTISGFYYISLRRSDGVVEGLYFDPTSTPYQHLRLSGQGSGWPAVELR